MDLSTPKVVCGVCHGKGGFRKLKKDFLDTNWNDCPYCEGYGFVDDNTTEDECQEVLIYNRYRNNLILELQMLGDVKVCNLDYVEIIPFDRKRWTALLKHIMKFSYHNENVNVDVKHSFYYKGEEELETKWELHIHKHKLEDIQGLIDLIKFYNDTIQEVDSKYGKY
jgi:hypothetical protein